MKETEKILYDGLKCCLLPLAAFSALSCSQTKPTAPNIIYVFPDQFRASALAFWDEPEFSPYVRWKADPVRTPVLDAFASESVVLSNAMSNCPLSSPYRGVFLTGMYPERSGIPLNRSEERR